LPQIPNKINGPAGVISTAPGLEFLEYQIVEKVTCRFESRKHRNCTSARRCNHTPTIKAAISVAAHGDSFCELLQAGCVENPIDESGEIYRKKLPGDASASVWRVIDRGKIYLAQLEREQER